MMKSYSRYILPLLILMLPLALTACSGTLRTEWQRAQQQGGLSGFFSLFGSCLLILLAMAIIFGLFYAQQRWQVLRLLRPTQLASRLPIVGPYLSKAMGVQRDMRELGNLKETVERHGGMGGQGNLPNTPDGYTTPPHIRRQHERQRKQQASNNDFSRVTKKVQNWFKRGKGKDLTEKGKALASESREKAEELWERVDGDDEQPGGEPARPADANGRREPDGGGESRPWGANGAPVQAQPSRPQPIARETVSTAAPVGPQYIVPQVARVPVDPEFVFDLAQATKADEANIIGRRLDRYQVEAMLGEGRASKKYQAHDLKLGRPVFLNVIRPDVARDPEQQKQLLEEVRVTAGFDHAHIVDIYDYDEYEGHLYIVAELITGSSLLDYAAHMQTKEEPLRLSHLLDLVAQVCDALDHAHQQGIVHGNVKKSHVLVEDLVGPPANPDDDHTRLQVKMIDFGLSHLTADARRTPADMWPFMAPEQCRAAVDDAPARIDGRTDVYAVGVLMYWVVTGRAPFEPDSIQAAARAHLQAQPVPPTQQRPGLPVPVEEIILRAMSKKPVDRYRTAAEMAAALRELADTLADKVEEDEEAAAAVPGSIRTVISAPGEEARYVNLSGARITVGAAPDNAVVLPARGVADYHARIERGRMGWRVIDMGSEQGTFIGSARLLPDLAEEWSPRQTLHIGPYAMTQLELMGDAETAPDQLEPVPTPTPVAPAPAPTAEPTLDPAVWVKVMPERAEVSAGERVDIQLQVVNQGRNVDHFRVEVNGLPPEWVTITNNDVQLMPGAQMFILMTVQPPRDRTARAGEHAYEVRVRRLSVGQAGRARPAVLVIRPFEALFVDMHPVQLINSGETMIELDNRGNDALAVALEVRDPADAVAFTAVPRPGTVPAGETRTFGMGVQAKQRPWLGSTQTLPFEVEATTAADNYPLTGQVQVRPRIPGWLATIGGVLFAVMCALVPFAFSYWDTQNQAAVATADAQATQSAVVVETATPAPTALPTVPPLPLTCADVRRQNLSQAEEAAAEGETPTMVDGEYTIYVGRDQARPLAVYCHNMAGTPTTYLSLRTADNQTNVAQANLVTGLVTTVYERVRLDPQTLQIDPTDRLFAATSGAVSDGRLQTADYGTAIGCIDGDERLLGRSNIDLTGTGLALAETVVFDTHGFDISGQGAAISNERQVVNLSISGNCGWVFPDTPLQLTYIGGQ